MNYTAIAAEAYRPGLAPTGQRNQRAARCAECKCSLAAGQGRQWDFTSGAAAFLATARQVYYCRACHEHRLALLEIEPELRQVLGEIETWCKAYIPLGMGWSASRHVERIARSTDLAAADVARQIADQLYTLDLVEYSAVITLARKAAQAVDEEWVL